MSRFTRLAGWDMDVEPRKFNLPNLKDGTLEEVNGFAFIFTEKSPPSGDRIIFECREETAREAVAKITGIHLP